jgi:hypothetical protein
MSRAHTQPVANGQKVEAYQVRVSVGEGHGQYFLVAAEGRSEQQAKLALLARWPHLQLPWLSIVPPLVSVAYGELEVL